MKSTVSKNYKNHYEQNNMSKIYHFLLPQIKIGSTVSKSESINPATNEQFVSSYLPTCHTAVLSV